MSAPSRLALTCAAALTLSSAARAQTVVTFSFDDTFDDQLQAAATFAAAGVRGTFYVNSARIGQPGFLTLAQVLMMQAAGNEIGGHTTDHLSLGVVPLEEEERQICDDRAALLGLGLNVTSLAYPHGSAPSATQAVVSGCGYNSARNSSGLRTHGPEGCTTCPYVETVPPGNALALRTPGSAKSTQLATDLEQNVLDAEARGGGWVPFVFHHVCDDCNPDAVSPAVMQELVNWVAARQAMGTTVKTVHEVIGGALAPAVAGAPPIPFVASDGNLLRNGDLEATTNSDGLPDCLQIFTGGANADDYTVGAAAAAHSGVAAAQIALSPGKTGTPRLASLQDLGYCSPPARTGDQFVFSFYYQASDPVAPVAYYRIASGWWKSLAQGSQLPASAVWSSSEWTLPAIPPEAEAISVGVTVLTTGTLVVDDYRLINLNAPADLSHPADGAVGTTDGGVRDGTTDAGPIASSDAGSTPDAGCAIAPATSRPVFVVALLLLAFLLVRGRPR